MTDQPQTLSISHNSASKASTNPSGANPSLFRPPVVAVMGHVDHGKTTLLDKIRSTHQAAKEVGGISQRLAASVVNYQGRQITFIDTPGHAAFMTMRSRAEAAADMALLVISSVEGVKPQTLEALSLIRSSELPFIVVLTKVDQPEANPRRVKEELLKEGVLLEGLGGDVVCLEVSGVAGTGIDALLEMINLTADLLELKQDLKAPYVGLVIESRLDPKKGPVALVIGKQGTLRVGQTLSAAKAMGKVKALLSPEGTRLSEALPSMPVEILGFDEVPGAGESIQNAERKPALSGLVRRREMFIDPVAGTKILNLIIRADSEGVLDAIRENLSHLPEAAKHLRIIFLGTGDITTSDVLLARPSQALIFAFAVKIPGVVADLARENQMEIRNFEIIYELTNEVGETLKKISQEAESSAAGRAEIIKIFALPSGDHVLGSKVLSGKIKVNDTVRVLRENVEICSSRIRTLKIKDDKVSSVNVGTECGILLRIKNEVKAGDILEVNKPLTS